MSDALARRGFLRQLAGLPLIGGGVTLLGNPVGAAVPVTEDLLWNYSQWLQVERSLLVFEMGQQTETDRHWRDHSLRFRCDDIPAGHYHQPVTPPPSTRAAVVLSAVGCAWQSR